MLTTRHIAAAALALATGLAAQSTLTTTFQSNNGADGSMFDIRSIHPLRIDGFDLNLDAGSWDVEIYTTMSGGSHVGLEQDPTGWQLIAAAADVTSAGVDQPTSLPFQTSLNIPIPCGSQRGFYVTVKAGAGMNYTIVPGMVVGDVHASNDHLEVLAGVGVDYLNTTVYGLPLSSRVFNGNVHYTPTTSTTCGASANFGAGCQKAEASFYETMTAAAMDLAGITLTATNNGHGYDVTAGLSTIAPIGANAVNCDLDDDDSVDTATLGGTLGLHVGSNGWIGFGPGNSTHYTPDPQTMLANPARGIYAWTDLQPFSSGGTNGDIWYEENGTVATVTFDGVDGWGTGLPNTIQFIYDTATGDFSIGFGQLSVINPEDWLIGYSLGGQAMDPGPMDLSAGAFNVPDIDFPGLELSSSRPALGTTWNLLTTGAVGAPGAAFLLGDTAYPGISLAGLGAPGCSVYTNGNLGALFGLSFNGTAFAPVPIPNAPQLMGAEVVVQSIAKQTLNAFGWVTSNGVQATIGF